jgi:hypothetical protein
MANTAICKIRQVKLLKLNTGGECVVEVYFYMPADRAEYAAECGIKLSEWYTREVRIDGELKKCITALFNPRDDYEKYSSDKFKCLKLELQTKYCRVADRFLYEMGRSYPEAMELYERSAVPVESYVFGDYRLPEVLVASTVQSEQISIPGKMLDTPLLYTNSQELYLSSLLARLKDEKEDLDDTFLYLYFKWLSDRGTAGMIEDVQSGLAIFKLKGDAKPYTFRIPGGHDEI